MNRQLPYCFWLFPIVAVSSLGLDIFIPGLPQMSEYFNADSQSTQLIISAYVFSLSLGQLVFGPYIDRYGCQRSFVIGIALCALASTCIFYAETMYSLILLRSIHGFGAGAVAVSVFASVPILFGKHQTGKVFSLFSSILSTVPVLAPILGGVLSATYSWRACFAFLTLYSVCCMAISWYKPLPSTKETNHSRAIKGNSVYSKLFSSRKFITGCMACSLGFSTQLAFFSSSPIVIIDQFGIDTEYFGLLFATNAFSITLGSLLVVKMIGKFKEESIIKAGGALLLIAGLGYCYHFTSNDINVWYFIVPACFGSFGFALLMSAGTTLALNEFSKQSGKASSVNGALQLIIASFFSWLVMSFWDEQWITISVFYCLCGLVILSSFLVKKRLPTSVSVGVQQTENLEQ